MFMERLERSIARGAKSAEPTLAVFFLDVDRFKYVNDSLGHLAGDELLVALSRRLEGTLRSTDLVSRFAADPTLARLGGDEFTILLDGVRSAGDATAIAERLLSALATPFTVQGHELFISVSVGIVLGDARYRRAEELVRDADTAMYRAKANGKARFEIFDVSMLEAAAHRLQIESDLRKVLERGELEVYYQPIVSTREQHLLGFEALVRWHHPERGLVLPTEFISIAEDTGLIVPIGGWVLREACAQMRAWQQEFASCGPLVINVNSSPRQLLRAEFVGEVADILADTGLAPECLKLEITEGVMIENTDQVISILTELRALGVQLGLDDFGMGYSALSYLRRFPFQTLKIDRSFISGIHESGNTQIVRAIVSMAEGLSMNVTAEGVETAEQLAGLQNLACDSAQGFYFAKPMPRDEARSLLQNCAGDTKAIRLTDC
jgi:diguanylate cyclase (GGDEF)-like protein